MQEPAQLEVTIDCQNSVPIVRIVGEIDLCTRGQFDESVHGVYACAAQTVVLDITSMSFIDGEGIGGLIRFYKQLAKQDKRLLLVNPQPRVRRILGITHVASLFDPIYPTLEEALTAAQSS